MLLQDKLGEYKDEIFRLYNTFLGETPSGNTFFGVVQDGILQATASIRCYHGHWYFRGCVVKPEYRGRGLQRRLIKERLEHLKDKTDTVRVSIYPWNQHSIDNVVQEGFVFEKSRKLANGKSVNVYRLDF